MDIYLYQKQITNDLMDWLLTADPIGEAIAEYMVNTDILVCESRGKINGLLRVDFLTDTAN